MTHATCSECGDRPALSPSLGKCEVCLYAEDKGWGMAREQLTTKERARLAKKRPGSKAKR